MNAMKVMGIFLSSTDTLAKCKKKKKFDFFFFLIFNFFFFIASLLNYISEGLRNTSQKAKDKKRKKGETRDRGLWEYSAVSCLKHKFKVAPTVFIPVFECLKSEYAAVTRNAAIFCYNQSDDEPTKVASTFTKFSESLAKSKIVFCYFILFYFIILI